MRIGQFDISFVMVRYLLFLYYFSGKLIEKQRVASVVLVVLVMVLVVLGVVLIIIEVVASHYCYHY